jgi:hypothetical protein
VVLGVHGTAGSVCVITAPELHKAKAPALACVHVFLDNRTRDKAVRGEALAEDAILQDATAHVGNIQVGGKQVWYGAGIAVLSTPKLDLWVQKGTKISTQKCHSQACMHYVTRKDGQNS